MNTPSLSQRQKRNRKKQGKSPSGDVYNTPLVSQLEPLKEGFTIQSMKTKTAELNQQWDQVTSKYHELEKSVKDFEPIEKKNLHKQQFLLSSPSQSFSPDYQSVTKEIKKREQAADLKMKWQKDAIEMGEQYSNLILLGLVFVAAVILFLILYFM